MARTSTGSPDEALAGMAKTGAPRVPMGTSAYTDISVPSATDTGNATLVTKGHSKAVDPTATGPSGVAIRQATGVERLGAAYGVRVNINAPVSAEAAATQANGRVFSSAVQRSRPSFNEGINTSY